MAGAGYVKQIWEDGVSPVNAERLNKMERGIELGVNLAQEAIDNAGGSGGGGGMVVNVAMAGSPSTDENGVMIGDATADKTLDEIIEAIEAGIFVYAIAPGEGNVVLPLTLYAPGFAAIFSTMAQTSVDGTLMKGVVVVEADKVQMSIKMLDF